MKGFSFLLALGMLLGCGGGSHGGGGSGGPGPLVGTYSGAFNVTRRGVLPAGFDPPSTGTATATVGPTGALSIDFGNSYVISGNLRGDGLVTSGMVSYFASGGTQALPATVAWGQEDGMQKATASVEFNNPFGRANFSALMTKQ